jgi:hypothetical protein
MTTRTETRMRELRTMPLFRQLVPMEAGVGWPIPVRRDGCVYMRLPLFGFRPLPERGAGVQLYPPFAMITVEWRTGRPVEYVDLRFSRPWPVEERTGPVGTFPHEGAADSPRAYEADRDALLERYDELFERLELGDPIPSEWAEDFGDRLGRLVEPALLPYFRILGEQFYTRFLGPGGVGSQG